MGRYDNASYVSATLEFRCNLRCVHCMIEGTMDRLQPVSDDAFEHVLRRNEETRQYSGLIMTGSEITLRRDLPDLARRARAAGFEHIRIQTHGMHLSRPGYAEQLIEAGVDEFFISVAGSDAATHDGITTIKGSFDKMLRGMEIVSSFPGTAIITNTVVTERSYRLLPDVVDALEGIGALSQMEFWHYFPMSRSDDKQLLADYRLIVPYLKQACVRADARGIAVEIKNVPQCLLGQDDWRLDNGQAALLIDPDFWVEFDKNGFYRCPHRERCASKACLGLTEAYIERFGDMAGDLAPYALAELTSR
jgi:MoaA/NifB/PqqE/SkfB family radical SAM enzyme